MTVSILAGCRSVSGLTRMENIVVKEIGTISGMSAISKLKDLPPVY